MRFSSRPRSNDIHTLINHFFSLNTKKPILYYCIISVLFEKKKSVIPHDQSSPPQPTTTTTTKNMTSARYARTHGLPSHEMHCGALWIKRGRAWKPQKINEKRRRDRVVVVSRDPTAVRQLWAVSLIQIIQLSKEPPQRRVIFR